MNEHEHLTACELAEKLKVSLAAVRKWTQHGMPCTRLGKRLVRFDTQTALNWLEQQQRKSSEGVSRN